MTTKVRTLLSLVVVGVASPLGAAAYAETGAAGTNAKTSAAQYAALADEICTGVPAKERSATRRCRVFA